MPAATTPQFSVKSAKALRDVVDGGADLRELEEALVRLYLTQKRTHVPKNDATILAISRGSSAADALLEGVHIQSVCDLVRAFEILVPKPESGRNPDAVFTPEWVAALMADEAITEDRKDTRVVDPSCGCGALLVAALRRIHHLHGGHRKAKTIVEKQLFGADIDEAGVRRVKLLLSLEASRLDGRDADYDFSNVVVRDSLDTAQWRGAQFDVVIGNPPYIRYHQLTEEQRQSYRERFAVLGGGNYNLYFAFFELAHELCAPGGVVAYITPNSYFRAASARALRRWMVEEMFPTKLLDFGCSRVFEAMTYTALTFADQRARGGKLAYAEGFDANNQPRQVMPPRHDFIEVPLADLDADGGPWRLVGKGSFDAVARAQSGGRPLSEVADIRFGVATLRDSLYLLDGATKKGKFVKEFGGREYLIEKAATRPAVRVSDVSTQNALDTHAARIIFPYRYEKDGRAVALTQDELARYPGALAYLTAIRPELDQRDKGKKTYATWFAYGRTQGLARWRGERLLTPLYAGRPRFLRDSTAGRVFLNGCSVAPKPDSGVSIELLDALLNSAVLHFFIEQTSSPLTGGFYSYQKGPLGAFAIHDEAVRLERKILTLKGRKRQEFIALLYGITLPESYLAGW